ncbi:hypothetical protein OSTOST_17933 [Ostertagia ostertagi]
MRIDRVKKTTNSGSDATKRYGNRWRNDDESGGGDKPGAGTGVYRFKGTREEYCEKFAVNYEYYCTGDSDNPQITAQFCPSYKKSCRDRPQSPANPFTKNVATGENPNSPSNIVDSNFPDLDNPGRGNEAEVVKEFKRRRSTRNPVLPIVIIESTHIVPRPANATGLIRMCKSSAILHLCRCSYKLAELPSNAKPFSVLSPNGERLPVNVRTPGTTTIAKDDPLPPDTVRWDSPLELDPEDFDPTAHVGKNNLRLTSIA